MVDGVVLERFQERKEVVRFANEDAIVVKQRKHAIDNVVNILDVREDISGGDDLGFPLLSDSLFGYGLIKK